MINTLSLGYFTVKEKLTLAFLSFSLGLPILTFIERYVFNDWDVLISVSILMLTDTLFGLIASIKSSTFSATKGMSMIFIKIATMAGILVCLGTIALSNAGNNALFGEVFKNGCYSVLIVFEAISVLKNIYKVKQYQSIKSILEKVKNLIK
jgi:phage-related holin